MTKTISSTVAFTDPQGTALANGILILDLVTPCTVTSGGGQVAPSRVAIVLDANGKIPSNTSIYANDELTPSGTGYYAKLYNSNMSLVADLGAWTIIGSSPIDLSQEVATTLSVSYPAPALLVPNSQQTLKSTTLTGASNGNNVSLLNVQANAAAIVGTGADATIYTYTIPANTVATGKCFRMNAWFSHSTGSASVTYKIKLGSTTLSSISNSNTGVFHVAVTVYNSGSGTVIKADDPWTSSAAVISATPGFASGLSADLTSSLALSITFNVAATDQVTPQMWLVELIQ